MTKTRNDFGAHTASRGPSRPTAATVPAFRSDRRRVSQRIQFALRHRPAVL